MDLKTAILVNIDKEIMKLESDIAELRLLKDKILKGGGDVGGAAKLEA